MTRSALALAAAACALLSACGDSGTEMAQAACHAYGHVPPDRITADEQAQRAGETNGSYASLGRDMHDAWAQMDAMAGTHNAGGEVSAGDLNAYFASDKRVRADCAGTGADLGPLTP